MSSCSVFVKTRRVPPSPPSMHTRWRASLVWLHQVEEWNLEDEGFEGLTDEAKMAMAEAQELWTLNADA